MKLVKPLLFFSLIFCFGTLQAQDIHYTLFNMSPLSLNPAQTGAFNGTFRIGGIYRDQWTGVISGAGFTTPSVYVDAPIIKGFGKRDWIGVGATLINDEVGTHNLQTNHFLFSGAYHLALDKKANSILTFGVQAGSVTRRLLDANLNFADEYDFAAGEFIRGSGANQATGGQNNQNELLFGNATYTDFSAGLMLRTLVGKESQLEVGFALNHITRPDYSLVGVDQNPNPGPGGPNLPKDAPRPFTSTAHARLDVGLTDLWSLSPRILFQSTSGATELAAQAWAGRIINKDVNLNVGLGYRVGDSAQALFGIDYRDLRVALSYDINVSSITAITNSVGGFEVAAYYIVKIFKKPTVKPAILCPRF